MINTILLSILVLFAAFYTVKALRPATKKEFFKAKLKAKTREVWDLEFKVEQTALMRESIRQDRDKLLDTQAKLAEAVAKTPNDKKLEAELAEITDTIGRYEKQMKMLDDQINGAAPSEQNPMGEIGINEQLASLAEIRKMYTYAIAKL